MDEVCDGHSKGEECGLNRVTGCIRLARLGVKPPCRTLVLLETGVATGPWFVLHLIGFVPSCGTCAGDICGVDNNFQMTVGGCVLALLQL
jgi:hypothetical protein